MRLHPPAFCAALAVGVLLPTAPALAAPAGVGCGDVVSGTVVLTADLVCAGSPVGLTLADEATLDLGGHRIVGDGTGTGIAIPGRGRTVVRGGVVTGWAEGVAVVADDSTRDWGTAEIDGLTVRGNDVGLQCDGASCSIRETTASDNGTAVVGGDPGTGASVGLQVTESVLTGNDVAIDARAAAGGRVVVWANVFRRNGHGILSVAPGTGVELNFARNNHRWGIHAPGTVDLGGNTARGNGRQPQCVGVVCDGPGPVS